eukprot:TRINITY_DN829_c0_g2_i1.p1 TRINITY_DN829_c0_g2~~TRINITY_DN829_c0_g2_i1.p1  ORF type:complete len:520 (+),score=132.79 TRINITY_DN829_c0_g2_i1:45-1562(+)
MARRGLSFFSRGEGTLRIPYEMHRNHRLRLKKELQKSGIAEGLVLLRGGDELSVYDTDTNWDFKQESNFQWLFGAKEPGLCGGVVLGKGDDEDTDDSYLFIPRLPDLYAQWFGPIKPTSWFADTYEVAEVHYIDEMETVLEKRNFSQILTPSGVNHDSGFSPALKPDLKTLALKESTDLYHALAECRVIKDDHELAIMQFTNDVSSAAHIYIMKEAQRPDRRMEYHSEAEFKYQSFMKGCSRVGYCCICPGAERNSTLHYGHPGEPNENVVKDGDLKLHDMGAEYHCYTADVTCTFPIGGKFSPEQKVVYNAVWKAVEEVEKAIKPGVNYKDLHVLSQAVIAREMLDDGLFENGTVEDFMAANLMSIFMPTGLGHQLGLDVHDVGGYLPTEGKHILKDNTPHPITQNLRFARPCQANMVVTVEPGFYFNPWLLSKLAETPSLNKFVNKKRLEELIPVGGVRIEDNIVITTTGCRVLNNVPRTTDDIEAVIAGKEWKADYRIYNNV